MFCYILYFVFILSSRLKSAHGRRTWQYVIEIWGVNQCPDFSGMCFRCDISVVIILADRHVACWTRVWAEGGEVRSVRIDRRLAFPFVLLYPKS